MTFFDLLDNYFRCCVNQMVKIMKVNLSEAPIKQGLETQMQRFYVFASPATKGLSPAPPLVVPPPCWRPLMAEPGHAFDTHLHPIAGQLLVGLGHVLRVLGWKKIENPCNYEEKKTPSHTENRKDEVCLRLQVLKCLFSDHLQIPQ